MSDSAENLEGDGANTEGDGGEGQDGQSGSLREKSADQLIEYIGELRKESAKYRTRASEAEGKVGQMTKAQKETQERLDALEAERKTDEEKEQERIEALEATAARADSLQPYHDFVKKQYEAAFAGVDALEDEDRKKRYTDLLETFDENDFLGRTRALSAIKAAEGVKPEMKPGDEGNPGESGGGKSEPSLSDMLKWSPSGTAEAEMAGLATK